MFNSISGLRFLVEPLLPLQVDPYVVTSKHLGVLTGNERVVLRILCEPPSDPYSALSPSTPSTAVSESFEMLFIPIGAQDVGTVVIHPHVRPGYELKRGEEIGMFSFGGSNIIVVFTPGAVVWDGDLEAWSSGHGERWVEGRKPQADRMIGKPIECFVRAGDGIGTLAGMVKDKAV